MSKELVKYLVINSDGETVYNGRLLEDSIRYLVEDMNLKNEYSVYRLVDTLGEITVN